MAIQHVGHHELPRAEAGTEVIVRFRPSRPDRAVVESFTPHALPPRSVEEAQRLVDQAQALKQELNQPGGGEAASGIILSSRPTGIVVDHRALVVELRVKVLPAHGAPFDAWLVGLVRKGHVDTFAPGREVHLLFDPEDRARVHFGDTSRTSSCVEGAARTPCYDG